MRKRPVLLVLVEPVLVAALLALFVRTFLFQAFTIPSGSMEHNLQIGDRILVNKFIYHPPPAAAGAGWLEALLPVRPLARGDVVVFRYPLEPERDFIKRCVGLPGDTIEIERRRLSINGQEIDESGYTFFSDDRIYPRSVVLPSVLRTRDNYGPYTVPEGQYFCLGDNRNHSHDSRSWGPVPAANVIGRGWLVYWSTASQRPATATAAPGLDDAAQSQPAPPAEDEPLPQPPTGHPNWGRMMRWVR